MSFFQQAEGEAAIISSNGVFKQVDVYTWNGFLFAKDGAGFIRLTADRSTSKPKTRLQMLTWQSGELLQNAVGHLCTKGVSGAKPIPQDTARQLTGNSFAALAGPAS